jgi:hypothetical protein
MKIKTETTIIKGIFEFKTNSQSGGGDVGGINVLVAVKGIVNSKYY